MLKKNDGHGWKKAVLFHVPVTSFNIWMLSITYFNVVRCCQSLLWQSQNSTGGSVEILASKGYWVHPSMQSERLWDATGLTMDVLYGFDTASVFYVLGRLILCLILQPAWFPNVACCSFKWQWISHGHAVFSGKHYQ